MSLRCNVWIFWMSSNVAGSLPSSFLQRWTFIGFSNSSDSAVTYALIHIGRLGLLSIEELSLSMVSIKYPEDRYM